MSRFVQPPLAVIGDVVVWPGVPRPTLAREIGTRHATPLARVSDLLNREFTWCSGQWQLYLRTVAASLQIVTKDAWRIILQVHGLSNLPAQPVCAYHNKLLRRR